MTGVTLDHTSPVPLYHQAARALEAAIEEGLLPRGSKLDNEFSLAEQLGVSRATVRAAIKELADKGLLVRRRGIGTVVAAAPIRRPIALTSLYDDLKKAGREPVTRVLAFDNVSCPPEVEEALHLTEHSPVWRFDRLRSVGSEPIALMHNAIPADILEIAGEDLERTGLYELFRKSGIRLHMATQQIGARRADPDEAGLLGIEAGDPLLTMTRTAYDPMGRPVEYGWHYYPAGSHSFEMVLMNR